MDVTGARAVELPETLLARVEGNRWRFLFQVVSFTAGLWAIVVLLFAVPALIFTLIAMAGGKPLGGEWHLRWAALAASTVPVVLAYTLVVLSAPEKRVLKTMGAGRADVGTFRDSKKALGIISPAAGFAYPPPLYVLESSALNAFVVGRSRKNAVVGVTRSFAENVSREEQMAVFAHLLARVRAKDSMVATAMTALMSPVWRMREFDYAQMNESPIIMDWDNVDANGKRIEGRWAFSPRDFFLYATGLIFPYIVLVAVTEAMAVSQRDRQVALAQYADAEGMMLLRDPHAMLAALEHVLPADNCIGPKGSRYSALFFCWPGDIPEDEVELHRFTRMRQVLGACGVDEAERDPDPEFGLPPRAAFLEREAR